MIVVGFWFLVFGFGFINKERKEQKEQKERKEQKEQKERKERKEQKEQKNRTFTSAIEHSHGLP